METNVVIYFVAALIPLAVGFVWYNPKVFGSAWMKAAGVTEEQVQGGNMALIFGLAYLFALFIALTLGGMTIHQTNVFALLFSEPGFAEAGTEANTYFNDFMSKYGGKHRSFGHGALHGALAAFLFAMPVIATNALFERKGFKYIAINAGYWIAAVTLMGGVICAYL